MAESRPNIVLISTHDSGRHFGCYGHPSVQTPGINQLASEGVRLTNCFCASPICSASRASMLTGMYPQSHGLLDLAQQPFNYEMRDGVQHLSQLLRHAGYHTSLWGLQHETQYPDQRLAFDEGFAPRPRVGCHEIAPRVATFFESRRGSDQPFYAQVGFFESHVPFSFGGAKPDNEQGVWVPPYVQDTPEARAECAALQGALHQADQGVATVLAGLEAAGLADNTIVIFTSDHGVELPRAKWFLYDPGIEVPMIIRWPKGGLAGGRTCDWVLSHVDFLPTLMDLIGLETPDACEGVSFAAGLNGEAAAAPPRDRIYSYFQKGDNRCVRTQSHKLIVSFGFAGRVLLRRPKKCGIDVDARVDCSFTSPIELYDLQADPHEFNNLANDPAHAAVRADLETSLWQWMEATGDEILQGPLRTPFYEAAAAEYRAWKAKQ